MSSATAALDAFINRVGGVATPFTIEMPDGAKRSVGQGEPVFSVALHNDRAVKAVRTLDEADIAEAYLQGDMDLDGDMLKPFTLRSELDDSHPLVAAWRFVQPLMFGQVYTNKQAIASHYNLDPDLFLSFLDPVFPAYSQGIYESDDEPLAKALERKFDWAIEKCELGNGKRALEIGPGWGAFASHVLKSGIQYTGITNSEVSQSFLREKLADFGDQFEILLTDFYDYEPDELFDAIVIMGVIEHLPNYEKVLRKFFRLLKPGGLVFLDGSAARKKYELSTFMVRYIYPGNHSFLVLDDFLNKLNKTEFECEEVHSDRWSYYLTFKQWAKNLEANKDATIKRFGDFEYRRFRLYLWGATYEFLSRNLDCYRLILSKPNDA
ncbi:MAG: class I SAM-dependent methyltransferase [Hyphomicrobiaceae bacterium]|jgi:cyclopropane-fatty-acyl-phospholipid synthase|nr:class I SAM-dependent methyltransferase [Methyloceanibacter sp.]MDX2317848.1 class I SAM-dependent methyltransferase [Hyphomicrobiaceae bacterium]MDX2449875.1 class I SAM-dependent methyltransferase [Hyphomicrobiaceae bacterium]